jgi:hypothetical protein
MRVAARSLVGPLSVASLLGACGGGGSGSTGADASVGPVLSGSPDGGAYSFTADAGTDAGPLLASCTPGSASSCPSGFVCYAQHTSASWWVDLYGTCTFVCNAATYPLCDSLGGVCGCPVPASGGSVACSLDGGASLYCVPGLQPGASPGANEGDGGCGTPGCGGGPGVEAGSAPADAALE